MSRGRTGAVRANVHALPDPSPQGDANGTRNGFWDAWLQRLRQAIVSQRLASRNLHGKRWRSLNADSAYICRKRCANARLTARVSGRVLSLTSVRPDKSRVVAATCATLTI